MLKNRLLKFLPLLLALVLVFTVSVFAVVAEGEDESSETSAETTTDETSDETSSEDSSEASSEDSSEASSEASSNASSEETSVESGAESSAASEDHDHDNDRPSTSKIPWKLIITVAVILVIAAVLFILAKTNSKLGQKIAKFFKDYKSEIGKISWMPRKDLIRSTLVVLAVLIAAGVAIGLLDFIFSELVKLLSSIG